jgi:hypothetical protein
MTYAANFANCGYVVHEYTNSELQPVWDEIKLIQNNFNTSETINHSFTSTVKKEYRILKSLKKLDTLISPLANIYNNTFDFNKVNDYCLTKAWVNFQERGEFFAPHTHIGEFSFALYLQVPFTNENEIKYLSTENKPANTASGFVFYYTDTLGEIKPHYIPIDSTWENKIIFFPGRMLHSVQPFFTSNDFRITISGNIERKTDD